MSQIKANYINGHKVVAGHIPGEQLMFIMSADYPVFVTLRPGELSGPKMEELAELIEDEAANIRRIDQMVCDMDDEINLTAAAARKKWWWAWW